MMIKSGATGNWIEPRVGDNCLSAAAYRVQVKVGSINEWGAVVCENTGRCFAQEDLTLIHRPFMVGDEVEYTQEPVLPQYFPSTQVTETIASQEWADKCNSGKLNYPRQHANPDWRDSSSTNADSG